MTSKMIWERLALRDRFKLLLQKEQEFRSMRNSLVRDDADGCYACEWALEERRAVLAEVNAIRAERGKQPIDERTLLRKAERQASGHCDYTSKYALYAAELAMGE